MWQFADLRFADPSFIYGLKTSANPLKNKFFPDKYRLKLLLLKFTTTDFLTNEPVPNFGLLCHQMADQGQNF
jgi:hypothetical protein